MLPFGSTVYTMGGRVALSQNSFPGLLFRGCLSGPCLSGLYQQPGAAQFLSGGKMDTSALAIRMKDVVFAYPGSQATILKILSFSVQKGERVFLRGPSGSGKTTLLGLISGIHVARQGEVQVLGQDLASLTASGRDQFRGRNIGYVFQMFNLIPYLNVLENVLVQGGLVGKHSAGTVEHARSLLSQLGMGNFENHRVDRLSVGQQQRVAAARALVGSPGLVIADEPTSALDYDLRDAYLDVLFSLCHSEGTTLLFVSHDPSLHTHFDRVVELGQLNQASAASEGDTK
jgi:putative ABC transport system ATP-binding protein